MHEEDSWKRREGVPGMETWKGKKPAQHYARDEGADPDVVRSLGCA
ncbi:MAG TPA: hypothetical protein VGX49_13305 [Jatrophihabitans sp.]|jgi:hypothetical protein|nr:hypothetical protein [Jatrophihabitans sp.]